MIVAPAATAGLFAFTPETKRSLVIQPDCGFGVHKYLYANADPVGGRDPTGNSFLGDALFGLSYRVWLGANIAAPAILLGVKVSAYAFATSAILAFSTSLAISSMDDVPPALYDINEFANEATVWSGVSLFVFSSASTLITLPNSDIRNNFQAPNRRHYPSNIDQRTVAKDLNTVINPSVNVSEDVAAINTGRAIRVGNTYQINGRLYGVHSETGRLFPISGNGLDQLNRASFKALGVFNQFGNTPRAGEILQNMGISGADKLEALKVYLKANPGS